MSSSSSSNTAASALHPQMTDKEEAQSPHLDDDASLSKFERPTQAPAAKRQRKTAMHNDIEEMMYGFGDNWPPNQESVSLIECMVTSYIEDLAVRAKEVSDLRGKMDKECFMYVVRKDRSKFSRACQLLKANDELKSAQKMELKEG